MCPVCGKVYIAKSGQTFRVHMELEHGQKPFLACDICGKPCVGPKNLKHHVRTHLGKDEKVQEVNSNSMAEGHEPEKFLCPECGCIFSRKGKENE